jgi:lysophospholipase L1-like esterase
MRRLLALVALLATAIAANAASAAAQPNYVSLGDSYTAGPLIPVQLPPFGCLKSSNNYPHLAAGRIGLPLRDASCSGAETVHMTQAQNVTPGPNPPQFDSLGADTRVVTVGIGGNDIGFSSIAQSCFSATPFGHPCRDRYVVDGQDELGARIDATAPKVAEVLRGIRARSPDARVFVVNYLPIFPETGYGCYPQIPVAWADVPYLRSVQRRLNAMLAEQAAANGATLVDAYRHGIGHDACKIPAVRWNEPLVPASPAAPLHPNLQGMIATANALVAAVRTAPATAASAAS